MKKELTLLIGNKMFCSECDKIQSRDSHSIREIIGFYVDVKLNVFKIVLECKHEIIVW